MKRSNIVSIFAVFSLMALVVLGCNWSTANMSSLTTSKDKEGKDSATSFKAGDTIYAKAQISNNMGKVKVKIYLVVEDSKELKKGETLKGSEVTVDVEGDSTAVYNVPMPANFVGGKFKLVADMINDAGEKKDSKSVDISVEGGAPTDGENKASDTDSSDESN